jgi:2-polyprenyl-3-methyl-5-hydroxy-6-metoxy-1,4-benzoquinol methylase
MPKYNTTQLDPDTAFERHIFHRDMFAHYLRWTHVLKEIGTKRFDDVKVLDFGCGTGNLYEVLYRNRCSPKRYLGADVRAKTIEANKTKFLKAEFVAADLAGDVDFGTDWDYITSFEVAEHVRKENVGKFLSNIAKCCNENTLVMISTPVFDPAVGAADNHIIDGVVGELTFAEMKEHMEKLFDIENVYGTFASKKAIYPVLTDAERTVYDTFSKYYNSELMSVIFAPNHPEQSRNCMWKARLKKPLYGEVTI